MLKTQSNKIIKSYRCRIFLKYMPLKYPNFFFLFSPKRNSPTLTV